MEENQGPSNDVSETETRGRGRPKLAAGSKRSEKLVISFTPDEFRQIMHLAADSADRPKRLQEWARDILLAEKR